MKNLSILGAFDRNNYGDILFPLIIKKYIEQNKLEFNISYYGLKEQKMEYLGGPNTMSVKHLYNDDSDMLIIAGGEVLDSTWYSMYNNFECNIFNYYFVRILNKINGEIANWYCKKMLQGKSYQPWMIDNKDFKKKKKIVYNSVGGTKICNFTNKKKKAYSEILEKVDYMSVRDALTKSNIEQLSDKIEVNLSPDSAIIMSDFYDYDYLEKNVDDKILEILKKLKKYIVIQTNKKNGEKEFERIVNQIQLVVNNGEYNVVLLPIGRAAGHEDDIILEKIKNKCNVEVFLPENNTIFDTMYIIAKSSAYIGTSLHGAITAVSYGVPNFSLNKNVEKLNLFYKTWFKDRKNTALEDDFLSELNSLTEYEKEKLNERTRELKSYVYENFKKMFIE